MNRNTPGKCPASNEIKSSKALGNKTELYAENVIDVTPSDERQI